MFTYFRAIFVALALSVSCCAQETHDRILNGTRVPESDFPTVGRLFINAERTSFGSGVLIAPQYVLTAAHCVVDEIGRPRRANNAYVFRLRGVDYQSENVYFSGSYKPYLLGTEGCYDMAIVKLSTAVTSVTPSQLYHKALKVGTALTIVGFGGEGDGTGENGNVPPDGLVNRGVTVIEYVSYSFVAWRFDKNESSTAHGDSGGPAFITENGKNYVAGITSFGAGGLKYGSIAVETRVDTARTWIEHILEENNNAPVFQSGAVTATPAPLFLPTPLLAGATDEDGDGLFYTWDFGDGATAADTLGAVSHTYPGAGTYTVSVTVTDNQSASITRTLQLTINAGSFHGIAGGTDRAVSAVKPGFSINFKTGLTSYSIVFSGDEFKFADATVFSNTIGQKPVHFLVGSDMVDNIPVTLPAGKGKTAAGSLAWKWKTGQVTYKGKGSPNGLIDAGITDETVSKKPLKVPMYLVIDGVRLGGEYSMLFTAKQGKTGKGTGQ